MLVQGAWRGVSTPILVISCCMTCCIVLLSASPEDEARWRCRKVWLTRNYYYCYYYYYAVTTAKQRANHAAAATASTELNTQQHTGLLPGRIHQLLLASQLNVNKPTAAKPCTAGHPSSTNMTAAQGMRSSGTSSVCVIFLASLHNRTTKRKAGYSPGGWYTRSTKSAVDSATT
jgi:hypothetical protein